MNIRAVIWDMGGVLVRTEDPAPRVGLATRAGLSREELEHLVFDTEMTHRAAVGQISAEELWQDICARLNLPPAQAATISQEFFGGDRVDGALVDYIRGLRPKYRIALLSNAWLDLRGFLENSWGIADAFDEIVISAEVGMMKPDPRIYQLTVARLDVISSEAVFVDDFAINVRAARESGLHAIHFHDSAQVRTELETLLET